jgi:anti-sigma factor RsiW
VLDGALAPDALGVARRHVDACAACRAELARLESTVALLRAGSPAPEPSPLFATRLAARLAAAPPPRRRGLAGLLDLGPWRLAVAGGFAVALVAGVAAGVFVIHRARTADELAVAERLELLEDLEVVASLDDVESPDDVAVIAALAPGPVPPREAGSGRGPGDGGAREGRP